MQWNPGFFLMRPRIARRFIQATFLNKLFLYPYFFNPVVNLSNFIIICSLVEEMSDGADWLPIL